MRARAVAALTLATLGAGAVLWLTRPLEPRGVGSGPPTSARPLTLRSSADCRPCHAEVYDEWRRSHHGIAYVNPEVQRLTKNFRDVDCLPCHAPEPVFETGLGNRVLERRVRLEEGVDCFACHRHGDAILGGPHVPPESTAPCNPRPYPGISDVAVCAPCHDLHKVVQDWRQSSFAVEGPGKKDCGACHMPPAPRAASAGKPAYTGRSHVFPGAHDAAFLRTAASFRAAFAPDGALEVEVKNVGAGHPFPADERHRAVDLRIAVETEDGAVGVARVDRYRNPYRDEFAIKNPLRHPGAVRDYPLDLGVAGNADVRAARVPAETSPRRVLFFPESTQIDAGEARRYRIFLPRTSRRVVVRLLYKLHPHVEDDDATLLFEATFDDLAPGAGVFGREGTDLSAGAVPAATTGDDPARRAAEELLAGLTEPADRARRLLTLGLGGGTEAFAVARRLLGDRSQAAFVLIDDPAAPGGVRVEESPYADVDRRPLERIAACEVLERLGGHRALPELLLALDDRDRLVAVHAAKTLLALGSRAGVPTLLDALEGKAYENENANRFLRDASGEDFGFNSDAGLTARAAAVARWRTWWAAFAPTDAKLRGEGAPYRRGADPEADRRISAFVHVLGGFQFIYMDQARKMLKRLGPEAAGFLRDALPKARGAGGAVWRGGMAQVLGGVAGAEADALLDELLRDDHPAVRARAVLAAAERGGQEAATRVRAALSDREPTVVAAATRALATTGNAADAAVLDRLGADAADAEVRSAALAAAYRLAPTAARFDRLASLAFDASIAARTVALDALNAALGRVVVEDPAGPEEERRAALDLWRAAVR